MIKLLKDIDFTEIIKTARVFEKNSKLNLDYRINEKFIIEDIERTRFSLGISATKANHERVEAEAMQLALNHYLKTNNIKNPNELYFKDIALEALEEEKDNRADDTHTDYIRICERYILPVFGDMLLINIQARHIKVWKNNLLSDNQFSKSRFNKYYRTLNFIIKYAYVNEMIDKNLMDLVDKKSKNFTTSNTQNSAIKYYSKQEIQKILLHAKGWFKVFITTLFYTGMRTGECIALKWSDVDFTNNTITLQRNVRHGTVRNTTKTGITNVIDMAEPLKKLLKKHFDEAPSLVWMFPNPKTLEPYWESKSIITTYLKPLLKKLGIEYKTLYATRHSFASVMVENNVPLTYVQKQLGHKRLSTTMDYYIKNGLINENKYNPILDVIYE